MIAFLWKYLFNPDPDSGINALLGLVGLGFLQQDWLGNPSLALWSVGFTVVWQFAGYSMVIFLAGLQGVPRELEEAAALDGAGRWQRFRNVILPMIAPAVTINLMLSTIGGLKLFDQVFAITNGGPGYSTETLSTLIYKQAFVFGSYGYSDRRRARAGDPRRRRLARAAEVPAQPRGRRMSFRYGKRTFALELGMIFVALLFLFPVYVLVTLSFKSPPEISAGGLGLPSSLETENYSQAWSGASLGAALLNSTVITAVSLVTLIAVGSTASYYLARKQSRLSYRMYIFFLLGIILPFQLALVPLYRMVEDAGLLGSYTSMILFYTGLQAPFTIFLYTGFLRALPREYGEAALVDGATHWQSFRRVTFPLLRPITGTVIILNAVFIWNDFLTPLIYLGGSANETLPVVVYQFVGQYVSNWGYVFAAVVLATLPMLILFLLLQRFVIKGFSSGLKG